MLFHVLSFLTVGIIKSLTPYRFTGITTLYKHVLLDTTIAGNGCQYTMPACFAGKQDELAVRRKTGLFLQSALSENLHLTCLKILSSDIKLAGLVVRKHKTFPIRAITRRKIFTLAKRHALGRATGDRHTIDLCATSLI